MNRAQRRKQRGDAAARAAARAYACPSCDADKQLQHHGGRVLLLTVSHEAGCPELARHERRCTQ